MFYRLWGLLNYDPNTPERACMDNLRQRLDILSFGFALGLLIGRVIVCRILVNVAASTVTLWAAGAMAAATFLMFRTNVSERMTRLWQAL